MTKTFSNAKLLTSLAALALVAGCSGNDAPAEEGTTETQMDDIEVIDGTINDDMVDLDSAADTENIEEDQSDKTDEKSDSEDTAEEKSE